MSSAHIIAVLPWSNGRIERGATVATSEIPLPSGITDDSHAALIYHFFAKGQQPPNDSACFIFGRFTPRTATRPFVIDAYTVVPLPGDPTEEEYYDAIPFEPARITVLGRVVNVRDTDKSFVLECSEHVNQERISFNVRCAIPTANKRFANLPLPTVGRKTTS